MQTSSMDQKELCLKWNNYTDVYKGSFATLLNLEHFTDVTLSCDNQIIKCHRLVLSACSSYFENLLVSNSQSQPIIILKDVKFCDLQALVKFMYMGEVSVTQAQFNSLLKLADILKVTGLATHGASSQNSVDPSCLSQNAGLSNPPVKRRRIDADLEISVITQDVLRERSSISGGNDNPSRNSDGTLSPLPFQEKYIVAANPLLVKVESFDPLEDGSSSQIFDSSTDVGCSSDPYFITVNTEFDERLFEIEVLNGYVSLETLKAQFPEGTGLMYRPHPGRPYRILQNIDGSIYPPRGGWKEISVYTLCMPRASQSLLENSFIGYTSETSSKDGIIDEPQFSLSGRTSLRKPTLNTSPIPEARIRRADDENLNANFVPKKDRSMESNYIEGTRGSEKKKAVCDLSVASQFRIQRESFGPELQSMLKSRRQIIGCAARREFVKTLTNQLLNLDRNPSSAFIRTAILSCFNENDIKECFADRVNGHVTVNSPEMSLFSEVLNRRNYLKTIKRRSYQFKGNMWNAQSGSRSKIC
ncbi:uncharacterized protein LOC136043874 isoform X2 [Artemia franciscana]|uniref:BTB domain-containing protein n=1 Tax=Artemia franciscana TaxID=6661 RepID=A0AA88I4V9_ARTSF|nr:hypothetical protein QYM36_010134 [Artemia franciscana]